MWYKIIFFSKMMIMLLGNKFKKNLISQRLESYLDFA